MAAVGVVVQGFFFLYRTRDDDETMIFPATTALQKGFLKLVASKVGCSNFKFLIEEESS